MVEQVRKRRFGWFTGAVVATALSISGCSSDGAKDSQSGHEPGTPVASETLQYQQGSDLFGFRVQFPAQPVATDLGGISEHDAYQWTYNPEGEDVVYSLTATIAPDGSTLDISPEEHLNETSLAMAQSMGGTVTNEEFVDFNGYLAQQGAVTNDAVTLPKVYFLNIYRETRFYSLMGIGLSEDQFNEFASTLQLVD